MFVRYSNRIVCAVLVSLCSLTASATTLDPVIAAYQKMSTAHFRSDTTSTDEKGTVNTSKVEFETLDRIHLTSPRVEIIMLPEGTWMRTGGGNWNKPPIDMSGMVKNYRPLGEEALRSAKNVTDNGMTVFQGQPAHSWTYDVDVAVMGVHANSHITTYLSPTGTLLGSESDGVALGHKTHTVQKVTLDNSIHVTAPN